MSRHPVTPQAIGQHKPLVDIMLSSNSFLLSYTPSQKPTYGYQLQAQHIYLQRGKNSETPV